MSNNALAVASPSALPWSEWENPHFTVAKLGDVSVRAHASRSGVDENLSLVHEGEVVAEVTLEGLRQLGHKLSPCPADFLMTLPLNLRATVLNQRISAHADREVAFVVQDNRFTNLLPTAREVLTYRETAEAAYGYMADLYGSDLEVERADVGADGMSVRLLTGLTQPITRKRGDVLALGLDVQQNYGTTTEVNLYLRRLICLNGMTTMQRAFSWRQQGAGSPEVQRIWLAEGIAEALGAYEEMVSRSQLMAETRFEGSPEDALRERARSMGLPQRHFDDLMQAYNAEPGETEWDLFNAFTRLGTHTALPNGLGQRVQSAAGDWAHTFDLVTARLPRPIANRVGASIIEAIDAAGSAD